MIDLSNPAFRAVFDRFKIRLRENRDRLRQLDAEMHPDAGDVFDEIRLIAHRLAGSAGTFNFAEVGASATSLDHLLSQGCSDPAMVRTQLRHLLAEIDDCDDDSVT